VTQQDYNPDINPIEQAFAKLKTLPRKAGERTCDGLWNAIAQKALQLS
jgi:transposase